MTDSNIKNLLNNEKEDTNNVLDNEKDNVNKQQLVVNNGQQSAIDDESTFSFTNVFNETNYTPTTNLFDNYINETLFDEEPFDFVSGDFNLTNNIFSDLTEEKTQRDLEITDNLLKYIGVSNYITQDFSITNKPRTRIQIEKIFKQTTGYSFSDVENNKISKEIIESPEFQTNLDKFLNSTYKDILFSDKVTIPDKNDNAVLQQVSGLGYEIGGGLLADAFLTPLLTFGPKGWLLYGLGQFALNAYFNIEAQKIRYGQSLTGNEDLFSWPEVFSSGLVGTIPLGTELKGLKGMFRSGIYGGALSTSEAFLRDLFGEDLDWQDYALNLGFGSVFGASLKGSIEGLENLYRKYDGLDLNSIKKLWTSDDTNTTKKIIKDLTTVKNKIDEKIELNGGDPKKIQQRIDEEVAKVKTGDTDNTNKKRVNIEETPTVKSEVTQELTFVAPEAYKRTKPRYGSATIQFQSDFDKLSWSLRKGRKVKAQNDAKILKVFTDQGFTEKEIRLHGDKVHAKIKSIVTDLTGNASASGNNTKGLNLEVPILKDFATVVQKPLNKTASDGDLDLGNTQVNPQKMDRIKDMKKGKQDFVTQKVRTKKEQGGFEGAETRSQFDTQESALFKMTDSKGKITGDPKNLKFFTEYTKRKALLEGKLATEEEVVINQQGLQIATDRVANSTQNFLEVIKKNIGKNTKKSRNAIDKAGEKIIQAEKLVDDWLGMGIPLGTRLGRAVNAFKIKGIEGIEGMTPAQVMKLSPLEKKNLTARNVDISPSLNKLLDQSAEFQTNLLARIKEGHETGDYSQVIKVAQEMKEASGSIEKMVKLFNADAFGDTLRNIGQVSRVINEVGINGVLSGLTSQRVNLYSGVVKTFLHAINNFTGQLDVAGGKPLIRKEGITAATKHLFALIHNFNFNLKVWKRSWDMEDNFINVGNSKIDTGQRFVISSDKQGSLGRLIDKGRKKLNIISDEEPFIPFNTINAAGKFIRLPSRLMTSNDALIQTPNILGSTAYHATMEAIKKGLSPEDLDDYVKSSLDGVIDYILKGQVGPLGRFKKIDDDITEFIEDPVLGKIFERAKDFGKEITYTQQIRGGRSDDVTDPLGLFAEEINNLAIQYPPVRTFFKFTRTPTNMIKDVMRYIPVINTPARFGMSKFFTAPLIGDVKNLNPLNAFLLPEIAADLRSPNPQVRANTRGQIYMGNAFATILGLLAFNNIGQPSNPFVSSDEYESEDEIPRRFITDGGPSWKTKEGAIKHLALLKSGWLPYAVATLLFDEDGEIMFDEDGLPMYRYESYEDLPDPILSLVKAWVDFQGMSPFFTKEQDRIYDEYTIGWSAFIGRVITNKTYVQQIDETIELFSFLPESLTGNIDPDDTIGYEKQKYIRYLGRLFESSIVPYSSMWEDILRLPADVTAELLGIDEREAQRLRKEGVEGVTKYAIKILGQEIKLGNVKNKRLIRLFAKMDTTTYSGDYSNFRFLTSEDKLDLSDKEYNEVSSLLQYFHGLIQQLKTNVPANVGGDLPFQVEHITNDVITYPSKRGFNMFTNAKYSKSKNNLLKQAEYLIGRFVAQPPDIIRGSKLKNFVNNPSFSSKDFVPIKLNNIQYNNLKKYINTTVLNFSGKNYNIADAMKAYIKGELIIPDANYPDDYFNYKVNKQQIEKYGLDSNEGKTAADRIYKQLNKINQLFINAGIEEYLKDNYTDQDLQTRINVKVDQQNKYNKEIEVLLDQLNFKRN